MTKRYLFALAMLIGIVATSTAQQQEQFSIATLNVDGLPQKIWFANVNTDGPGSAGSVRIGQYLQKKGYDLVFVQEDFNYHEELTIVLEDDYRFDTWSGDVGVDGHTIDILHLQNHCFECDGLGGFWKKNISVNNTQRTPWEKTFGKFSHAGDAMVTKGFRRYDVTLPSGTELIVYNMHMDASSEIDEKEGKDAPDREARLSEWLQLKDDILAHLNTRPIIVVGDLNSYYSRDKIKEQFIDAIESTGQGTVKDVWVELEKSGQYPTPVDGIVSCDDPANILEGETLDKILYINPAIGTKIQAVKFSLDQQGYMRNGKMLGDHFPLAATFAVGDRKAAGINDATLNNKEEIIKDNIFFNLQGQRIAKPAKGVYIESNGKGTRKHIIQ
jgi:endonuclease/exonuclease/phosphatase family metal-dependent hydrolase